MSTQGKSQQPDDVKEPSEVEKAATPFSLLTYLLQLVTSLNSDKNLPSSFKKQCNSKPSNPEFTVLDSIAAILVQDHEVVAACYTSDTVSVITAETDLPSTDIEVDGDVPCNSVSTLQLAALSNPDFRDILNSNQNPHKVQIQTNGESLWEKVQGSLRGWYCAFMGPLPLRDHIATVCAYLNDYKSITVSDSSEHQRISTAFTNYLISTCWPKMSRRIISWQATGFIFLLTNIGVDQIHTFASSWNGFPPSTGPPSIGAGDRTLLIFLQNLGKKLKGELLLANNRDEKHNRLNYTQADFPLMFASQTPNLLFSKENAREFHKLTVAAFEGYAFIFSRLRTKYSKLDDSEKKLGLDAESEERLTYRQRVVFDLLRRASNHYRFLLVIICSNSFKTYFEMIKESQKQNVLPVLGQKDLYNDFRHSTEEAADKSENAGVELKNAGVELENAEVEADELDDDNLSKGDQEESLSSLLRFIKTFVIHLTAKRTLEKYCFRARDHEINISLFSVERSSLCMQSQSWPAMQDILKESLLSDPSKSSTSADDGNIASEAIALLEKTILNPPKTCSKRCRDMLCSFQKIIEGHPLSLPGGLHCEAVLATLYKYFESFLIPGDDNTNLVSTCKKLLHSDMISVSKLCCPVCWELLTLFCSGDSEILLRGSHSTIYPVELPNWVPPDIVQKMDTRFRNHLREEMRIMLKGAEESRRPARRNHHVTHQSESNLSVASSTFSTHYLEDNE